MRTKGITFKRKKKTPIYPEGRCFYCGLPLSKLNPRTACFRCQGRGLKGEERNPIKKSG